MKPGKCREIKELKKIMATYKNNTILNLFVPNSGNCRFHLQLAYNNRMILSSTDEHPLKVLQVVTEKLKSCSVVVFLWTPNLWTLNLKFRFYCLIQVLKIKPLTFCFIDCKLLSLKNYVNIGWNDFKRVWFSIFCFLILLMNWDNLLETIKEMMRNQNSVLEAEIISSLFSLLLIAN